MKPKENNAVLPLLLIPQLRCGTVEPPAARMAGTMILDGLWFSVLGAPAAAGARVAVHGMGRALAGMGTRSVATGTPVFQSTWRGAANHVANGVSAMGTGGATMTGAVGMGVLAPPKLGAAVNSIDEQESGWLTLGRVIPGVATAIAGWDALETCFNAIKGRPN